MGLAKCHILTPKGTGAIGVIRISGLHAERVVTRLCRTRANAPFTPPRDGQVRLARVVCDGEALDEAVISRVPLASQESFDLCLHGGIRMMERVSETLHGLGAPSADSPLMDETVHRGIPATALGAAFDGGCDLVEREALTLMPSAPTCAALEMLAWQRAHLPDALRRLNPLSATDLPLALAKWQRMRNRYESARLLIEGCAIAIVGSVNSGKSTLFNRMVGREAALVSSRPGTTRDWVSETVDVGGIAVTLHDTAGINANPEAGEQRAIDAGHRLLDSCRLVWHVMDASDSDGKASGNVEWSPAQSRFSTIRIWNKADLLGRCDQKLTRLADANSQHPCVVCSALTGEGVAILREVTLKALGFDNDVFRAPSLFTERQRRVANEILSSDSADSSRTRTKFSALLSKNFDEVENAGL